MLLILLICILSLKVTLAADKRVRTANNPEGRIPSEYTVHCLLVGRDYSWVFKGERLQDSLTCVIKVLDKRRLAEKQDRVDRAEREAASLMQMHNTEHIVNLLHTMQDDRYAYLVTEFLNAVELELILEKIRFIAGELVLAIESVHTSGYIHRDVKPENILITATGHVKLVDFGFAVPFGAVATSERCGSPLYAAAEYQDFHDYDQSVDWFALGICLWQVAMRSGLLANVNTTQLKEGKTAKGLPELVQSIKASPEMTAFLQRLLSDAQNRPKLGETLRRLPWLESAEYGSSYASPINICGLLKPASPERNFSPEDYPMFSHPTKTRTLTTKPIEAKPTGAIEIKRKDVELTLNNY